ncbi:Toprim sub domain-containing protein [Brevibacillus sp. 179-C 1.1 NHS]|uniref:Toprim sub domain-containing protein n=1 Tax=Brevibacillus sp. 179-C 1.1 NHS TaxID=3235177 RepID=UPI0039A065D1
MLDPLIIAYIKNSILKNFEHIDLQGIVYPDSPFVDVSIIKRTERTYRIVGVLTLTVSEPDYMEESPDEELMKKILTARKKINLDDNDPITLRWLEEGWIMKEIRLKKDQKTVASIQYRMGYRLYKYREMQLQNKKDIIDQELQNWNESAATLDYAHEQVISLTSKRGLQTLVTIIHERYGQGFEDIRDSSLFPSKWPMEKRLKFLHFVLAFVQIALNKTHFDWKEIGASYYKEIGGSKEFDLYKDEFIAHLENWAQCSADSLGLTSLGKITPLYFAGQIVGQFSTYQNGPVHALTDIAIDEEEYSTDATTLWLVENRSILTRIAAEKGFLMESSSLVLCVDGHLRTSHRLCIQQLLKNSSLDQVIIWSDYDPDGLQISRELYLAVALYDHIRLKWITHILEPVTSWQQYEAYMLALLNHQKMEQEQMLGGVNDWKKWISH